MSAPNVNKPDEGIIGKIGNSVSNAANAVSDTVQGKSAEASKEANLQKAKGNGPNSGIGDRLSGALGAASDKMEEEKHDKSAKVNKEAI